MIFRMQTKEASITRAQKREENKLRKDLVTMLSAITIDQWQWEDPALKYNFPYYIKRTIIKTTMPTGVKAKLIRDVVKADISTEDLEKHGIDYLHKYELYINRIYMSSERYNSESPATGTIGKLFETIEKQIKPMPGHKL